MNVSEKTKKREAEIRALEGIFLSKYGILFPKSYREFLIEHGNLTVAGLKILGIPEQKEKPEKPKTVKPEDSLVQNGWLDFDRIKESQQCLACGKNKEVGRVTCYPCYADYSNESRRQYVHIAIWIKNKLANKKAKTQEQLEGISVVEATQFLLEKRPNLAGKKLIPIFFKKDLNAEKIVALCMDLSENPKDDAPLVAILDIDDAQAQPVKHDPEFFSGWLLHVRRMAERHEFFKIAFRRVSNRNNEVLEKHLSKFFGKTFGQKCPICQIRERKVIVFEKNQGQKTLLVCEECEKEWRRSEKNIDLVEWIAKKLKEKVNLPCFTEKGEVTIRDKQGRKKEEKPNHIHLDRYDWRTRIFRVTDYVVGITAFRYSQKLGCLEVDAFWSGDLAGYVKGQAIRNLAIAVLSEANSLTGSLALAFTGDGRESGKTGKIIRGGHERTSCPVPQELIDFAEENSILLSQAEQGAISHQDGLNLFWAALGWPEHLQAEVDELEKKGYLTKQALAGVIYSGIWSKEEAVWIFENAPRPEAILLGSDLPEDRLYYTESLAWARSAYLANLLRTKISADLAGGLSVEEREESDCELEPYGGFWLLKSAKDFTLPWMVKESEPVPVKAGEPVLILSVPCQTTQEANDLAIVKEYFKMLKETESPAKIRCLLVSFEFSDLKYGMKVSEFMKANSKKLAERGVYLLFSPYRLDLLNDEAENRMFSARRRRQFLPRKKPLRLQLIELPEARWQKPDLLYSVQDAKSAAYWIEKKVDLRLGRIRFRVNCSCIERIAVQDAGAKFIATADGQDSKNILAAMASESGITAPFVPPDEMPEFTKEVGGKLRNILKAVKGGLVVLASFEKSESPEETETTATAAEVHAVASGFRFSVNLDSIDISSYAIKRPDEIARTHKQIQRALRTGEPLAVSYLRHEIFVEAIREYLFKKGRTDQVNLRIVYNDGGESRPFPLFCLTERKKPEGLYQMKVGSISMRHAALDLVTDGYLVQNVMISKRKLSSVEQEDYAFRQTRHFLAEFVDLLQHKRVKEVTGDIRFRYLWSLLDLEGKKSRGCELHIFQTGLTPATVGIYRAVVEFLQERRGELVVVPRLIGKKADAEKAIDAEYLKAAEWF